MSPQPRADEGDKETRRRRRLSKPLTNKSSANLLMLSAQQTEAQANSSNGVDLSPSSLSTTIPGGNALQAEHTRLSDSKPAMLQDNSPIVKAEGWKGTALILGEGPVREVDSPTLLTPIGIVKARRPFSAIFAPRFSGSQKASDFIQRRASLQALVEAGSNKTEKNRLAATLPDSSENQSDALSPRLQRRSSFTPGVATRTSRKTSLGPSPKEERLNTDRDYYYNSALSEESPLSQLEVLDFDEDWAPPAPPVARSETPSDLDYTHLGGLRLGSLRVVNGRASPAPSELSRHLAGVSTPNLKRNASSNYGDGDDEPVVTLASLRHKSYRGRDQGLQDFTHVRRRPVASPMRTHSDTILLPKRTKQNVDARYSGVEPNSSWTTVPKSDMPVPQIVSCSPDKTSELAMAYMAELCASPYSEERSNSPTGSILKSTSKATEFDDNLFEDDSENLSTLEETKRLPANTYHSSNDAVWMYENAYSLSVKRPQDTSPRPSLQPSNSTGSSASAKPDSGYGSKTSLPSAGNRTHDSADKMENSAPHGKVTQAEAMQTESTRGRSEPRPSSLPPRPSILKRGGSSGAAQLPGFPDLHSSTTTLATITSTRSAPSDAPTKLRKLQKKARPRSQPPPVRHIVMQGQHRDVSNSDIPPIPPETAANLAIRTQQVPELGHTFSSMDHTRKIESSPNSPYAPTHVDFPRTDLGSHDSSAEVSLPTPPPHRSPFIKWLKSERRNSQRRTSNTSGIGESDAMAIIHNLDMAASSMGGSPYDVASKTTKASVSQASQPKTPTNRDNQSRDSSRPKQMMDDVTAAELARLRSRTIAEREEMQWTQRRSPFRDREGIPGRSMRPSSTAGDAPPLPPLLGREQMIQQEVRRADYQQPYLETRAREGQYWAEQFSSDPYESAAPPPPSHPPPPRPIELAGDMPPLPPSHSPRPKPMETWEDAPAPPPPSHSPRPRSIPYSDEVFAPPPPSHSPRPMPVNPEEDMADIWAAHASAWKSRRKSIGEMLRSRALPEEQQSYMQPFQAEESAYKDPIYPEIPLRRPQKSFTTGPEEYPTSRCQFYGAQTDPILYEAPGSSGPSYHSFAGYATELESPQQPPHVGRYSGGLAYGYTHGVGFGDSAGTSDVRGVVNASRSRVPPTEGFGVDLSDVPIIVGIRRKPVGCQ